MDLDPTMTEGEARDFLALFDFRGDEVEQRIATLSGGERGRLSLSRIVFGGANLLLLDEPTNHLDLDARERLEEALSEFEGAIVFVSHDRWFVDRIATRPGDRGDARSARGASGAFTAQAAGGGRKRPRGRTGRTAIVDRSVRRPDRVVETQRAKACTNALRRLREDVLARRMRFRQIASGLADPARWRDGPRQRSSSLGEEGTEGSATGYARVGPADERLGKFPA
jgi:ATP-binding cassette subfamily F protein 3